MNQQWAIRAATERDNDSILDILEAAPQMGVVQLAFERRPSYFNALLVSHDEPEVYVYEDLEKQRIAGMFSCGKRDMYINGKITSLRYTGDLRIHPKYQGTRVLFRMAKVLKNLSGEQEWMHTVILSDNAKSMHAVSTGRGGLPDYYHQASFVTHSLFLKAKKLPLSDQVRGAKESDIPAMQALYNEEQSRKQFAPLLDLQALHQGNDPHYRGLALDHFIVLEEAGEITAMMGLWDQESFKQTRVTGYHWSFALSRHLYNLWAKLFGGFTIPPKGETLHYRYAYATTCKGNSAKRLGALLSAVSQQCKGEVLTLGLDKKDPLNQATKHWRKHTLGSEHFVTSYQGDPREQLDECLVHPEIARL
ncbi:conserved hypothetical protein [gamma proteobacterium HTCC5015]|nr:conserved hypothetical protein [gamma proteobacterium HTCC5015]